MPDATAATSGKQIRSSASERESNESTSDDAIVNMSQRERVGSVVAGSIITLAGYRRHSNFGAILMLLGGGLLRRGVTGFCPMNAAMGRDDSDDSSEESDQRAGSRHRRSSKQTANGR